MKYLFGLISFILFICSLFMPSPVFIISMAIGSGIAFGLMLLSMSQEAEKKIGQELDELTEGEEE